MKLYLLSRPIILGDCLRRTLKILLSVAMLAFLVALVRVFFLSEIL